MTKEELLEKYKSGERNFRDANLSGADLSTADLYGAELRGANLLEANLCYANLFKADLSEADLSAANLSYANLRAADLRAADLRAADLRDADLRDADLRDAILWGANLSAADLRHAILWGANLRGAYITSSKRHEGVKIDTVLLSGVVGPHWMFAYRSDSGEIYVEWGCKTKPRTASQWLDILRDPESKYDPDPWIVSMFEAWSTIKTAMTREELLEKYKSGERDFRGADLRDTDLGDADLRDADLRDANLRGADLSYANMRCADLGSADMSGADLVGAVIEGVSLSCANLHGAKRQKGVKIDTVLVSGVIGPYWMFAYRSMSGEVYVEWGCETKPRTASQWLEERQGLTGKHEYDPGPWIVSMLETWSKANDR